MYKDVLFLSYLTSLNFGYLITICVHKTGVRHGLKHQNYHGGGSKKISHPLTTLNWFEKALILFIN